VGSEEGEAARAAEEAPVASLAEAVALPAPYAALSDQAALEALPKGAAQLAALCDRGHDDPVTDRLCAPGVSIGSLEDLERTLGLGFSAKVGNGELGNPAFAILSHSTSLTGRHVSPINPRAFLFSNPATKGRLLGAPQANPDFVALAFVRGEPLAELVSRDRKTKALRFFLVRFELDCEKTHCAPGDLYGPAIEGGWRGLSVYDDTDLENTIFDCNVCHQPGGPSAPKMLRMIEQRFPWTHFFRDADEGKDLISDYYSAHAVDERYAGIDGRLLRNSEPSRLEGLVENEGFMEQPEELPTNALAQYVMARWSLDTQPEYAALFERAQKGSGLPVPFPAARFADSARLREAALGYKSARKSKDWKSVPSLASLHSEEAAWRSGLAPAPHSDGASIVVQMCSRCHNGSLDPTLSRARFDATRLDAMSEAELALAVERMKLPESSPLKMPPPRFGSLTEEQIEMVTRDLVH